MELHAGGSYSTNEFIDAQLHVYCYEVRCVAPAQTNTSMERFITPQPPISTAWLRYTCPAYPAYIFLPVQKKRYHEIMAALRNEIGPDGTVSVQALHSVLQALNAGRGPMGRGGGGGPNGAATPLAASFGLTLAAAPPLMMPPGTKPPTLQQQQLQLQQQLQAAAAAAAAAGQPGGLAAAAAFLGLRDPAAMAALGAGLPGAGPPPGLAGLAGGEPPGRRDLVLSSHLPAWVCDTERKQYNAPVIHAMRFQRLAAALPKSLALY